MTTRPLIAPGPLPVIINTIRSDADHFTEGRTHPLDYLVVHATETTDHTHNVPSIGWLTTQSPPPDNVSAHHLYGRDGTRYDLVYRKDTAYHAGHCTIPNLNARSCGHELENSNTLGHIIEPYPALQRNALAYTLACELIAYGIPWAHVVRHGDVANQPVGRRHDPVGLDWADLAYRVQAWLTFLRSVPAAEAAHWFI